MTDREFVMTEVATASIALRESVATMTATQFRGDSVLPDWTRAHVVAHICGFANAMARQFEYALRGETIQPYDGGVDGRNADIEALVAEDPAVVRAAMDEGLDRLTAAIGAMGDADWELPISYRDGTAFDGLLAAWRELVIHLVDLDVGHRSSEWTEAFCAHLFDFLAPRIPAGTTLIAGEVRIGDGDDVVRVEGSAQAIAAWLAGREPATPVVFESGDEPALDPWPARKN